jgi:uncharacterized caspase-like protein
LTDGEATTPKILNALSEHASKLEEDEPFLFFFSGHGERVNTPDGVRSYLLSHEADLDDFDNTALRDDELLKYLSLLSSHRQIVILDACHSGGIGTLKSARRHAAPKGIGEFDPGVLSSGRGRVMMMSCRPDETSIIIGGARNSVFSASLLGGLNGKARIKEDGTIGVMDLFSFVSEDVPKNAAQHPIFKADQLEGNFSMARAPAVSEQTEVNDSPSPANIVNLLSELLPLGPLQNETFSRAGGDLSRLSISGNGVSQWHHVVSLVTRGGGGIGMRDLLQTIATDFPLNERLARYIKEIA